MESIGPRIYLVGQILPALIEVWQRKLKQQRMPPNLSPEEVVDEAIRWADLTLERMQWPNGKPR